MDDIDAFIRVERAKREAGELLGRYEVELARAGRLVETVHLGILRQLITAPVDFVARVDALREACPEMDRLRVRAERRSRLDGWRREEGSG